MALSLRLAATLARHGARSPRGGHAVTGIASATCPAVARPPPRLRGPARPLSAAAASPATSPAAGEAVPPPTSLAVAAGLGAQDAMRLSVEHGLGRRKLERVAADKATAPLVERWQRMIAAYLETQCHAIALLGYTPDEHGIRRYTEQLTEALRLAPPDAQEKLRAGGRDTYRAVLAAAFDMPELLEEQKAKGELSVVDARNIMHKVSLRMQDPAVLEKVAKRCSAATALDDSPASRQLELARKHTLVQEAMVKDVYLAEVGGGGTLVAECGFGEGEEGYVRMQSMLAEYQGDPLINQYVGAAMVQLLRSAGIDMGAAQSGNAGAA